MAATEKRRQHYVEKETRDAFMLERAQTPGMKTSTPKQPPPRAADYDNVVIAGGGAVVVGGGDRNKHALPTAQQNVSVMSPQNHTKHTQHTHV